jgi:OTU domain-containing protein 3
MYLTPIRTKGGQGKAQKGKKQKKKEPEAAPVKERKSTVPLPDLGALCI